MKKQYIQPVAEVTLLRIETILAALSAGDQPQGGDDNYKGTYGNEGNPGTEVTGNIEGTGTGGSGTNHGFTQGAKQNSWSDWDD